MRRDAATGLLYRPGDRFIVDEVKQTYAKLPVRKGDVMLDLGANIGATSLLVLAKGAARVIAVEADPSNIAMLRRNLPRKSLIIWAAVGPHAGRIPFYADPRQPFNGSRFPTPRARSVQVPMVPLSGLLAQYQPSIVKCDIEFGEYDLPELRSLPDSVRVLAMEIHIRHRRFAQSLEEIAGRRRAAVDLVAAIEAQGFKVVRRKDNMAGDADEPVDDDTGLAPRAKAINAIWRRS